MGESRTWLPNISFNIFDLEAIHFVCISIMSKKVPDDKHRDEIIRMEEGSSTRSHRWDASALEGVSLVGAHSWMSLMALFFACRCILTHSASRAILGKVDDNHELVAPPRHLAIKGPVRVQPLRGIIRRRKVTHTARRNSAESTAMRLAKEIRRL